MKRKLLLSILLCAFAGLTLLNLGLARSQGDTDTTLDLISVMAKAYDEGEGGGLQCICVLCPGEEFGCWSYDYTKSGNEGYEGSWFCIPSLQQGVIEQHVIDVNPNACQGAF